MDKGHIAVFGPALDPKGVYGFGVVEAADEELMAFILNNPSLKISRVKYYPMIATVAEK
jgi:hypothetical protein